MMLRAISLVLCAGGLTQIAKTIVEAVSINVIDQFRRPSAMHVKPCDIMKLISAPFNLDGPIPLTTITGARSFTDVATVSDLRFDVSCPCKLSRFGVVIEQISDFFCGNHGPSKPAEQQYESSECQPDARNSDEQKCSEHGRNVGCELQKK